MILKQANIISYIIWNIALIHVTLIYRAWINQILLTSFTAIIEKSLEIFSDLYVT